MKPIQLAGPCLAASLLMAPATAQAFDWSLEATITNDLIDGGERLSPGRPAGVLVAEAEAGGFFAGIELQTIRIDDDRIEIVPFLGYRHDLDPVEVEIGIAVPWADDSGRGDVEIFAGIEWAVDDRFTLGVEAAYAPSPRDWADVALTGSFAINDRLDLSATVGRVPADRLNYAKVGLTYALTDALAADFRAHNAREIGTRVALSLTATFGN